MRSSLVSLLVLLLLVSVFSVGCGLGVSLKEVPEITSQEIDHSGNVVLMMAEAKGLGESHQLAFKLIDRSGSRIEFGNSVLTDGVVVGSLSIADSDVVAAHAVILQEGLVVQSAEIEELIPVFHEISFPQVVPLGELAFVSVWVTSLGHQVTHRIWWGDEEVRAASLSPLSDPEEGWRVEVSHLYPSTGEYQLNWEVRDNFGRSNDFSAWIRVQ